MSDQQRRYPRVRPPTPRRPEGGEQVTEARQPVLGDPVHFSSYATNGGEWGKECRAAVVTRVRSNTGVSLCVFGPASIEFVQYVSAHHLGADADERAEHRSGTWHWPDDEGGIEHR